MNYHVRTLLVLLLLSLDLLLQAQDKDVFPKNILKDDSISVAAIARYPENARKNILEASQYPEALVKIELLQQETGKSFKSELEKYDKETQSKIWNICRYPGLLHDLTEGGKKTKDELKKISEKYPAEIANTIIERGRKDYEILKEVNRLSIESDKKFESLIAAYSDPAKSALREIIKYPEAIKVLTDGMRMTVLLGDAYKKDPVNVKNILDSLSAYYAEQNAKDLEDWKSGLEKNPEAKKEMEDAAKKFARDEGYDEDELVIQDQQIVVNYVCYPYSYWMGYPWWYAYPYWYPYPYWYDWGFYWTPGGIVYIGFPSPYFNYWYFYHHHHHYYYYHYTDYCLNYHYGHRNSRTEFNHTVDHWVSENESTVPQEFFTKPEGRPERIKEFGKFSIEYDQAKKQNNGKEISREEYLQNNAPVYPHLKPNVTTPENKDQKPYHYDPVKDDDPVYHQPARTQPKYTIPKKPDPVKPRIEHKPRFEPKITPRKPGKR